MHISASLILYLFILCLGAAIGGLIERALKRGSTPRRSLPTSNNLPIENGEKLANEGDIEALGVWRARNNNVWLKMDGKRLENKESLEPDQRQRLIGLVLELRPWLETSRPAAPLPSAPVQASGPTVTVLPVAQPMDRVGKQKNTPGDKPAPVLESIIQQIDRVLQAKLATSDFKERGVQLLEGPGGIVLVKDGIKSYEGVDAVPDPQVQALIRQAVADWEKGVV